MPGNASPIEFWFDFSSPYGYFASHDIEALAARHGRGVAWRPFLLGAAFRTTSMAPLVDQPLRGEYARRDWQRLARLKGVPFYLPAVFPVSGVLASRIFYFVEATDVPTAVAFAKAAFDALFVDGRDISEPAAAMAIGSELGLDGEALVRAAATPEAKTTLRARTDEALERGIFGSPFFVVDGEPFWGSDRLAMLDEWLTRGGW